MKRFWSWLLVGSVLSLGCGSRTETRPPAESAAEAQAFAVVPSIEKPAPGGIGSIEIRNPAGDAGALSLRSVHISAHQQADVASVSVEHLFFNDSDATLEGTFRFPMPDGAILTGLAMEIGGKLMEGELVEREKARRVYENIVDSMLDPALLEWEHGTTFKLRVFPIEPHVQKRVVLRYLVPLRVDVRGMVFVQGTSSANGAEPLKRLSVSFDDRVVFDEMNVLSGRRIEVVAESVSAIVREQRAGAVYSAVRLSPNWARVPPPKSAQSKHWMVIVDTSRSALEERDLQRQALREVLSNLPKGSRFRVFGHDLEMQAQPEAFAAPTRQGIERALAFIDSIRPDGATDLGAMIQRVADESRGLEAPAVVYIGDFEPTWGMTDTASLVSAAKHQLQGIPFHSLVLGASVDTRLAEQFAEVSAGRFRRALRYESVVAFARGLAQPSPIISDLEIKVPAGVTVLPAGKLSLEPGRETVLLLKSGPDFRAESVSVHARVDGKLLNLMPKAKEQIAGSVARRFGAAWVEQLQREHKPKEEIVQASLQYGVMSQYTSLLVLESEDAYQKYAIERRNKPADSDTPRVTGVDLESLGGDAARISITRFQPGDPEITINAPSDATVVVVFPSGESRTATYDPSAASGRGGFMVRFLVERDTPEGTYHATAHVFFRDGRHEVSKVAYTVDSTAPRLRVEVRPARGRLGAFDVFVTQDGPEAERDLRRVEVLLPNGTIRQLTAVAWAKFRCTLESFELEDGGVLRFVGVDQALNQSFVEVAVP